MTLVVGTAGQHTPSTHLIRARNPKTKTHFQSETGYSFYSVSRRRSN